MVRNPSHTDIELQSAERSGRCVRSSARKSMRRDCWPIATAFALLLAAPVHAGEASDAIRAFTSHCFTKDLTEDQAMKRMRETTGTPMNADLPFTLTFYDTTLTDAPDAAPGTDRRCAIAFDGDHADDAKEALLEKMDQAPVFGLPGELPPGYVPDAETAFLQGRYMPDDRCAVVYVDSDTDSDTTTMGVDRIAPGAC